jgi:hypothetical protein
VWVIDYECFKLILEEVYDSLFLNIEMVKTEGNNKTWYKKNTSIFFKMEVFETTYVVFLQQINRFNNFV